MPNSSSNRIFYGWWIVAAAFLNLFFVVGIIFYGFPVFYPALVDSLHFTRAQVTQGFLLGFLIAGLPAGFLAGAIIDRIGARWVILTGIGFVGISLILMGFISQFWQYELLCILEVIGYVLAGPIANQVLVARWFTNKRGRAMGFAYLGLGLGGFVAALLVNYMIHNLGWRHALQFVGLLVMGVLMPIGLWVTRSTPEEMNLLPDGISPSESIPQSTEKNPVPSFNVMNAVRTANFWRILLGSTLVMCAIGAVIQHFILFLKDQGYPGAQPSHFFTALLASGLAGRVLVGYVADRFSKKNTMALSYFLLGASLVLLGFAHQSNAVWLFAVIFGFCMGADYMLIPLVTAECFGTASLGKLLALIIMGYSLGQWGAPWIAGRIFDARHSYDLAWKIMAAAGMLGAITIYTITNSEKKTV